MAQPDPNKEHWLQKLPYHKLSGDKVLLVVISLVVIAGLYKFHRLNLEHNVHDGFPQAWQLFIIFLLLVVPVSFLTLGVNFREVQKAKRTPAASSAPKPRALSNSRRRKRD